MGAIQTVHRLARYEPVPDDAIPGVKAHCECGHATSTYPNAFHAEGVLLRHIRNAYGARSRAREQAVYEGQINEQDYEGVKAWIAEQAPFTLSTEWVN